MGYTKRASYVIQGDYANANMADSSTYYIGSYYAGTNANLVRIYIPRNGTIRSVYVYWNHVTQNCSAEDTTITVRKNDTTSATGYTGTMANAAAPQTFIANLPVTKGDYIHLTIATPAWVTNPTGTYLSFILEITC